MHVEQAHPLAFLVLLDGSVHGGIYDVFTDSASLSVQLSYIGLRSKHLLLLLSPVSEDFICTTARVLHEVVGICGESLFLLVYRALFILSMSDALLDASECEQALDRGPIIRLDKVLVEVKDDLGLAVGAAMETDELDDRLGNLLILAETQENTFNDCISETNTGSCIKRKLG